MNSILSIEQNGYAIADREFVQYIGQGQVYHILICTYNSWLLHIVSAPVNVIFIFISIYYFRFYYRDKQ